MQKNFRKIFLLWGTVICIISFMPSCRVAKHLPEGQSLLVRNKFILQKKELRKAELQRIREDASKIVAQKPNRKLFNFIPIKMGLYYSASHGKLTKFKQWIMDKVGEPPVVYDSVLTPKSVSLLDNYLFNMGYFHATVTDTVITKKKKTTIIYTVTTGKPWIIGEIELPNGHTSCDSIVRERRKTSYLRKGERFDINNLKAERNRIDTALRNSGYFFFNPEYISFDLDSGITGRTVNIKIKLSPPNDALAHKQYRINNIYVIADYASEALSDTTTRDTIIEGEYRIIAQKMKFRKKVLLDAIFFKKGDIYSQHREQRTFNHLSQLGVFKFINIDYVEVKDKDENYLDCIIKLTPGKKQSIGATGEVNLSIEGLLGTAGSLSYRNKNLTKGADQLLVDVSAGLQLRFSKPKRVEIITTTLSANVTYYLNKFLVPFRSKIFSRNANPKTKITLGYNFENRYDFDQNNNVVFLYQLHNFNFSYGYEWSQGRFKRHVLNPISVSLYLLPKTGEEFIRRLNLTPILKSSFEEQVIIGPNYTFTYSNQKTDNDRTYMFFRTNVETAGNVIEAAFKLANLGDRNDSVYLIANKPFSQYFRVEGDWRNYFRMTNHSLFAIRTYAGIGVPYGNSYALPFVKQFFVGGPNSLRGFSIREIGPGGYADTAVYNPETGPKNNIAGFFNQTGDIKLETNAEIRFDIYRWFKGALFVDAGNVWTLRKDTRLNGNFDIGRFWSEFAVDAGAGIRLDFNFFVVRFDYGLPLRDPRRVEGKRWQFANEQFLKDGQFQLAIGYPF